MMGWTKHPPHRPFNQQIAEMLLRHADALILLAKSVPG